MIHALLIDDETHNRNTLRRLLEMHCPQVSVEGEAGSVREGIRTIQTLKPELVFLDINMQDGTGFDIVNALGPVECKIIFVSAFDKGTLQTMKRRHLRFLCKPISPDDLMAAVTEATIHPGIKR